MPAKDKTPNSPIDAYKAIIDQLVSETSHGVSEKLVAEKCIWTKSPGEDAANAFVGRLSTEDRHILARMLHYERTGAIHDVLAVLTWWTSCAGVGLTFQGEPMPVELSGMGMHGDYVGRLDDWEWPQGDDFDGPPSPISP